MVFRTWMSVETSIFIYFLIRKNWSRDCNTYRKVPPPPAIISDHLKFYFWYLSHCYYHPFWSYILYLHSSNIFSLYNLGAVKILMNTQRSRAEMKMFEYLWLIRFSNTPSALDIVMNMRAVLYTYRTKIYYKLLILYHKHFLIYK